MHRRRSAFALLSAPWRRAPWLLLRYSPGVFFACAAAALVLSVAAASGSLFLASTATAALHNEASLACPEASQPAVGALLARGNYLATAIPPARLPASDAAVRSAVRSAGLGSPYLVTSGMVPLPAISGGTATAFVFARAGAIRHVRVLSSRPGRGVYVPATFARANRLHAGSPIALGGTHTTVTGVYRDLAPSAFTPLFKLPRYWCSWTRDIVPTPDTRPPPLFLTDTSTLSAAATSMGATWYDPTPITDRTVPQAEAALAAMKRAATTLGPANYHVLTQLGDLTTKAERIRSGLRGPVVPIDLAGVLIATLLVAGSGVFWGLRRARELALLSSRGIGRGALGLKAALETAPALLVGTVLGWLTAIGLVKALGPSARLEAGAPSQALLMSAGAMVVALLAVAITGARTVSADARRRPTRRWLRVIPWELALLALSGLAYRSVRHDGAVRIVKTTVQINPLVIAFPLFALTGAILFLGRGGRVGVARLPALGARLPAAGYLAARRLAGTPAVAIGVLVGVALPVAVLVYSSALSGSTNNDVQAKYQTNVGAPYAFGTLTGSGPAPELEGHGTIVTMIDVDPHLDNGTAVAVMGVDPDTFSSFAYQGHELAGPVDRLRPSSGHRANTLLVNAPAGTAVRSVTIGASTLPLTVVARRASFPGLRNPYEPLLVVDRAALPRLDPATNKVQELWTTPRSVHAALATLSRQGVDSNYEITPKGFLDSTGLRPVTWIFGYLRALALLVGAIALTGLAFGFAARTRRRALSYYLARRMGMSRATHRRSLAVELGTLLAVSWAAGVGLAVGAVAMVYRLTDAYPTSPPAPAFPETGAIVLATAGATAATVVLGVVLLQRLVDRAAPAELLRS